jgi:superfamily II DNA or RNA helicase
VRVFETADGLGFHPKAYLIHRAATGATAFVGSSNLTVHALRRGLEWNQRLEGSPHRAPMRAVIDEFEHLFTHPRTRSLTSSWIRRYEQRRRVPAPAAPAQGGVDPEQEPARQIPTPHGIQQQALDALAATRQGGNRAGLVVMATGLGKTWLAAFDSVNFERVLFIAHREEILNQAMRTFRGIRPDADLGLYGGGHHDRDADVLFASVQTLSRANHLGQFDPARFDYVVIDEFHHAAAASYRRLIDHFAPAFLLGLTATPERTDGGDLLALCGENLVFRCDLVDGINSELLAPFQYFGVPDVVEFENIPWRSGRFDPEALEHAVATELRAANAFDQWQQRAQRRTLAFCVSQRHADFMVDYFRGRGVRCVAVHSGARTAPRTESLEDLASGRLQIVFAVDMFNEGVDVPTIDTVMMLRPTESKILWLQQFGRGLRRAQEKSHLTVIDYIGNHRTFLQVPMLLLPEAVGGPGQLHLALKKLGQGLAELPLGCSVQYELEALEILEQLAQLPKGADQVAAWYRSFEELHGRRPLASEAYHEGYDPKRVRQSFGGWPGFVHAQGGLDAPSARAFEAHRPFLEALERTPMTRSFKMVTLLAMIAEGSFPGAIDIEDLVRRVTQLVGRSRRLREDFGEALGDPARMRGLLERNPIAAWCRGEGMGGQSYFAYADGRFATTALLPGAGRGGAGEGAAVPADAEGGEAERGEAKRGSLAPDDAVRSEADALASLTQEICDWRLAQYLDRAHGDQRQAPQIVCSVSHSGGRPMLFLPDRDQHPGIPESWTPVTVQGESFNANFVKVAVNVLRREGSGENCLPEILRGFFGEKAGQPGTGQRVRFVYRDDAYELEPLVQGGDGPER